MERDKQVCWPSLPHLEHKWLGQSKFREQWGEGRGREAALHLRLANLKLA
jgi:hypothetical protein